MAPQELRTETEGNSQCALTTHRQQVPPADPPWAWLAKQQHPASTPPPPPQLSAPGTLHHWVGTAKRGQASSGSQPPHPSPQNPGLPAPRSRASAGVGRPWRNWAAMGTQTHPFLGPSNDTELGTGHFTEDTTKPQDQWGRDGACTTEHVTVTPHPSHSSDAHRASPSPRAEPGAGGWHVVT